MDIRTVKIQGDDYLINGCMVVPSYAGNRHYKLIQEWLNEGNTPEPEFTPEELAAQQVDAEEQWVLAEIAAADKEINKHDDAHGRTTSTQIAWRNYRNQLRDRVQGGVVSSGERPARPT